MTNRENTGSDDWRDDVDEDGFPVANEDRNGDLWTHPSWVNARTGEPLVYVCRFIEGLGWCWYQL